MILQEAAAEIWRFREQAAAWWPTPSVGDSLRFAFTEMGEALDARLRDNPVYARNHARERQIDEELAQCAIMLMTALGPDWRYGRIDYGAPVVAPLDEAARAVGLAFAEFVAAPDAPSWRVWAEFALIAICRSLTVAPLPQLIDRELARIEARHMPERLREAVAACGRVAKHKEEEA